MTAALERLVRWLAVPNTLMFRLAGLGIFVLMLLLIANIVMRQLGRPMNGTFEVVAMVAAMMFALSFGGAQEQKAHVSIDLVERHWPKRVRLVVGGLLTVASLALFVQLITSLVVYGLTMRAQGSATDSLGLPFWPSVFVVVIGLCGLALALVSDLAKTVLAWRSDDPAASVF